MLQYVYLCPTIIHFSIKFLEKLLSPLPLHERAVHTPHLLLQNHSS